MRAQSSEFAPKVHDTDAAEKIQQSQRLNPRILRR